MRRHFVLATALLIAASGCIDTACTLIGCSSGLRVKFLTPPTVPYRIEATSGLPQGQAYVFECVNLVTCTADSILFTDFLPSSATIKVITATGSTTTTVTPEYSEFQPNGARCGPTCTSATVEVPFP